MRKLVFIGNCQVEAVHNLYRRFASQAAEEHVHRVRSYEALTDIDRQEIEAADLIIEQVQDFRPVADVTGLAPHTPRIGVPVVHCGFLWPFAGQPHPNNPRRPFLEGGPYDAELGNAFLNRLIKKNADIESSIEAYVTLDVNKTMPLDRLLELVLEKQHARDLATGFKIAPLIEQYFRTERLFLTPYHPDCRIALALAEQTLQRIGVPDAELATMCRAIRVTPFPKNEHPIHPAIAEHFGLTWVDERRRYRFLNEGSFSFSEFTRRYMECRWNEALEDGLALLRQNQLTEAYERLMTAVAESPDAAAGHGCIAHILYHLGRYEEALGASQRAMELDPDSPSYRVQCGLLLERAGDPVGAEREYRVGAALEPFDAHYPGLLGNFLLRQNRAAEALAIANLGLVGTPRAPNLYSIIGHANVRLGALAAAEQAFRCEAELARDLSGPLVCLADLREQAGDEEAATSFLRDALERDSSNDTLRGRLARLLERAGRSDEAAAIWTDLAARTPIDARSHHQLITALIQADRLSEAKVAAERAHSAFPDDPHLTGLLTDILERTGNLPAAIALLALVEPTTPATINLTARRADLLLRQGDADAAEATYRQVIASEPGHAHSHGQLGYILSTQQRHDDAILARTAACRLAPGNPHRHVMLAHTLMAADQLDAAESELLGAIAALPEVANFHLDLAHLLERLGRSDDAISAATRATELSPNQTHAHALLAHLHHKVQNWDSAEASYRRAIDCSPANTALNLQLSRMLTESGRPSDARNVLHAALALEPGNAELRNYLDHLDQSAAAA